MFMDSQDALYTPEKFFFQTIELNYWGCPGPLHASLLKAFWSFLYILLFLLLVFIIVMAFSDAYKVSSTNRLMVTVAGGLIPFLFRTVLARAGGGSTLETDSVQFQTELQKAIEGFKQTWPISDIGVAKPGAERNSAKEDAMPCSWFVSPCHTNKGGGGEEETEEEEVVVVVVVEEEKEEKKAKKGVVEEEEEEEEAKKVVDESRANSQEEAEEEEEAKKVVDEPRANSNSQEEAEGEAMLARAGGDSELKTDSVQFQTGLQTDIETFKQTSPVSDNGATEPGAEQNSTTVKLKEAEEELVLAELEEEEMEDGDAAPNEDTNETRERERAQTKNPKIKMIIDLKHLWT